MLTGFISEIWEDDEIVKKKSDGAQNMTSKTVRQVKKKKITVSQIYLEEKTKANNIIITQMDCCKYTSQFID